MSETTGLPRARTSTLLSHILCDQLLIARGGRRGPRFRQSRMFLHPEVVTRVSTKVLSCIRESPVFAAGPIFFWTWRPDGRR